MSDHSLPLNPGAPLAGKYRVEKVLGKGGMGVVVRARHLVLDEWRAIKFLLANSGDKPEQVERFLREARAMVKLKSAHVAKVQDVGLLDSGEPFIVMEYLEGADLKALLERRGSLPVAEAVGYIQQVLKALGEAHRRGIVHRDLKPANLFMTSGPSGEPFIKVLDFGISKMQQASDLTGTSETFGTPYYMSPNQMLSARDVDRRDDLWSVGVVVK